MTVTSRLHGRDVDDDVYYDIRWSLSEEDDEREGGFY